MLTLVHVRLLRQLIVGVAVCIYGVIHLFKGHQGMDQRIVSIEKTA